jgi:leader peptidase (prepilin peptidase)/N-methyltransferase
MASRQRPGNCAQQVWYPDMEAVLLTVSACIVGWIGGGLVNWAADILPGVGDDDVTKAVARPHWLQFWAPFRAPSSRRYLLVIIVSAALAVLMARQWGWDAKLLAGWLYGFFLLAVIVIDIEHHRVLNVMLAPAAIVIAVLSALPWTQGSLGNLLNTLLGGAVGFGVFLLLAIIGRGALGMGDVKLAGVIGMMTGHPDVLWALIIGALAGAGAALILLMTRKATRKTAIAYAPYLAFGAFVMLWTGL